jgi:DNA-binding NtrC family response regulator
MRPAILCIDDEPQILEGLKLLLGRIYDIHTAGDGHEGLKVMEQTQFPVVICDLRMPGISGSTVLESMAERWPTTVGILLTGAQAFGEPLPEASSTPAFRFLSKPCDSTVLREAITAALTQHQRLRCDPATAHG